MYEKYLLPLRYAQAFLDMLQIILSSIIVANRHTILNDILTRANPSLVDFLDISNSDKFLANYQIAGIVVGTLGLLLHSYFAIRMNHHKKLQVFLEACFIAAMVIASFFSVTLGFAYLNSSGFTSAFKVYNALAFFSVASLLASSAAIVLLLDKQSKNSQSEQPQ
jgi:hypothetical protein